MITKRAIGLALAAGILLAGLSAVTPASAGVDVHATRDPVAVVTQTSETAYQFRVGAPVHWSSAKGRTTYEWNLSDGHVFHGTSFHTWNWSEVWLTAKFTPTSPHIYPATRIIEVRHAIDPAVADPHNSARRYQPIGGGSNETYNLKKDSHVRVGSVIDTFGGWTYLTDDARGRHQTDTWQYWDGKRWRTFATVDWGSQLWVPKVAGGHHMRVISRAYAHWMIHGEVILPAGVAVP
jgi:hypothetical protein